MGQSKIALSYLGGGCTSEVHLIEVSMYFCLIPEVCIEQGEMYICACVHL